MLVVPGKELLLLHACYDSLTLVMQLYSMVASISNYIETYNFDIQFIPCAW